MIGEIHFLHPFQIRKKQKVQVPVSVGLCGGREFYTVAINTTPASMTTAAPMCCANPDS